MNEYELQQVIQKWVADNYGGQEADDPSYDLKKLAAHVTGHFNDKQKYNGWSNYATWRVNLELIEGEADAIREDGQVFDSIADLADHLKQMVDDYLEMVTPQPEGDHYETDGAGNILASYANAFLEDVNWYEIAENMASDNPAFVKESK